MRLIHIRASSLHFLQDTIKTRMQLDAARYPSMGATGRTIVAEEGVPALWKGLAPFAVHLFTKYALRFGTNATFQVRGFTTSRSSNRSAGSPLNPIQSSNC